MTFFAIVSNIYAKYFSDFILTLNLLSNIVSRCFFYMENRKKIIILL